MNLSKSRLNETPSNELASSNLNGKMGQSGNNFSMTSTTSATLKGKLLNLEEKILNVANEMNAHKKNVLTIKNEKEALQEILKQKTNEVKKILNNEIDLVGEEMSKHFTNQKNENAKLRKDIAALKDEKTELQNSLIALQRMIGDLEVQIGMNNEL